MTNPIVNARNIQVPGGGTKLYHRYWCPGCDNLHQITINPDKNGLGAGWDFSGTLECPTYSPSQLSQYDYGPENERKHFVCHTFIREGKIQFLGDCTHELANQTVDMVPLPDWVIGEERTDID